MNVASGEQFANEKKEALIKIANTAKHGLEKFPEEGISKVENNQAKEILIELRAVLKVLTNAPNMTDEAIRAHQIYLDGLTKGLSLANPSGETRSCVQECKDENSSCLQTCFRMYPTASDHDKELRDTCTLECKTYLVLCLADCFWPN